MRIDSNTDYNALFSSLNTNNAGFSLSDYASIKNGSYGKLMKAYYGKNNSSAKAAKSSEKLSETETKNYSNLKTAAGKLDDASKAVSKAIEDGDSEKIYEAAKNFADTYNDLTKAVDETGDKKITRVAQNMVNSVGNNLKLLNKAGFSMSESGKLSVDKDKFTANLSTVTTLFSGVGSFGDQVASRAFSIGNKANSELNVGKTYTSAGAYNNAEYIGKVYDSYF